MLRSRRRITIAIGYGIFLMVVAGWTALLYQYPPGVIVDNLGVKNGFVVAFLAALLGGLSTFTSAPYTFVILTLGAGGLNPFLLGLVAAAGLVLGDTTSYLLGYYGREVVSGVWQERINRFSAWLVARRYAWVVPLLVFIYASFFPFSNDVVVISFGLARYPFKKLIIPLALGSVVFNTLVALAGAYGMSLF